MYYKNRQRPIYNEQRNNALPIVLAIIVAAVIIIGGYICYSEYEKAEAKKCIQDVLERMER